MSEKAEVLTRVIISRRALGLMMLSRAQCSATVKMRVKVPHPVMDALGPTVAGSSGLSGPAWRGPGHG